jgi:hypothetical protein
VLFSYVIGGLLSEPGMAADGVVTVQPAEAGQPVLALVDETSDALRLCSPPLVRFQFCRRGAGSGRVAATTSTRLVMALSFARFYRHGAIGCMAISPHSAAAARALGRSL